MRNYQHFYRLLTFSVLVAALFIAAACQGDQEIAETEATAEEEMNSTDTPEMQLAATAAPVEQPAEEPTEEPAPPVDPSPPAVPVEELPDLEDYVSVTEFFSLKVPDGWSSKETFPGGAYIMANSEAALDRYQNGRAVEPGDFVLNVGFMPFELLKQREIVPLGIQFEATPDIFLQSLLPILRIADGSDRSDPQLVSVSDTRDAGLMAVADEGREGVILMFPAGDGVLAFVSTVGFPGEIGGFQDITYAVADGVVFNGDQAALYGTLLES